MTHSRRTIPTSSTLFGIAPLILALSACGSREAPTGDVGSNSAPVFAPAPTTVGHSAEYRYQLSVTDRDGDAITITVLEKPGWLVFDANALTLSGTPGRAAVGTHQVGLLASDGIDSTTQTYSLQVTNSSPSFGTPVVTADHNRDYVYRVATTDPDGDQVSLTVLQKPDWISFNEAIEEFSGLAGWDRIGPWVVSMRASDGIDSTTFSFTLSVLPGAVLCTQDFGDPATSEYILPFPVGIQSRIIQGYCRASGGHVDYFAYDFELAMRDTIYAARAGLVYFARGDQPDSTGVTGQENLIYIEHADGTVARYVHMLQNGVFVTAGDVVTQGQAIGINGLSGATRSPHLHFDVWRNRDWNSRPFAQSKPWSLPVNFRNAVGTLDGNQGLAEGSTYTSSAFVPDNR